MKKLERRAILCLCLAAVLIIGLGLFVYLQFRDGGDWAAYPANKHIYKDGHLATGSIYDVNGTLLLENTKDGPKYNSDYSKRVATLHAVGDNEGNIATGANTAFGDKLVGYNFINGVYSTNEKGRSLYLTIDSDICEVASEAMGDHDGTIGVYNYETGEIICMVSKPDYDPQDPPQVEEGDDSGIYMNKLISATIVPGSTFKLVTSAAAIDTIEDIDSFSYTCAGVKQYATADVDKVSCPYAHGTVDFEGALAKSCNCAFAELSEMIGQATMEEYAKKSGLTSQYKINGIKTAKGSAEFPESGVNLAWASIGQYHDLVNPAAMMIYAGAIANGGKAAQPRLIDSVKFSNGWPASIPWEPKTDELIGRSTANTLSRLMKNNVEVSYGGESNFPGLDLYAKSGTAQLGGDQEPHSWFTGFIKNEGSPYAFVVVVEHGGWGSETAGSIANEVLQAVVNR